AAALEEIPEGIVVDAKVRLREEPRIGGLCADMRWRRHDGERHCREEHQDTERAERAAHVHLRKGAAGAGYDGCVQVELELLPVGLLFVAQPLFVDLVKHNRESSRNGNAE